jgi:hypothetical protein
MTILNRCKDLIARIEARNELKRAHKDAEALRLRTEDLRSTKAEIVGQLEKLAVLRRKGVNTVRPPSPVASLGLLRELINMPRTNPTEISKSYAQAKRTIEAFRRGVESAGEKAIDAVNRDLPSIDESFLKQVEMIPGYSRQVGSIREQRDRLLGGKDIHQMAAAELDEFLNRRESLRALVDQLLPTEFPKEVLDFFKAARHEGAPLDKFTESVRAWLEKRNQLKNVRVIVKS